MRVARFSVMARPVACVLIGLAVLLTSPAVSRIQAADPASNLVRTRNARLVVTVDGAGATTLMLVHGYELTRRSWDRVVARLDDNDLRIVWYDLAGHGASR